MANVHLKDKQKIENLIVSDLETSAIKLGKSVHSLPSLDLVSSEENKLFNDALSLIKKTSPEMYNLYLIVAPLITKTKFDFEEDERI